MVSSHYLKVFWEAEVRKISKISLYITTEQIWAKILKTLVEKHVFGKTANKKLNSITSIV